jgi:hypothetical protein
MVDAPHFEIPRLRALARRILPVVIEGTAIPVGLFLLMLGLVGIWGAIAVGLGWSYSAIGRRLITGRPVPGVLVLSCLTLTVRSVFAISTGSTFIYFLQPTLGTLAVSGAFLVTMRFGQPLAQRIANDFCPIPDSLLAHVPVQRFFLRVSLLWAGVAFVNGVTALWLQLSQSVGTYVLVKNILNTSLTLSAVAVSILWFQRSMRRHGLVIAWARA